MRLSRLISIGASVPSPKASAPTSVHISSAQGFLVFTLSLGFPVLCSLGVSIFTGVACDSWWLYHAFPYWWRKISTCPCDRCLLFLILKKVIMWVRLRTRVRQSERVSKRVRDKEREPQWACSVRAGLSTTLLAFPSTLVLRQGLSCFCGCPTYFRIGGPQASICFCLCILLHSGRGQDHKYVLPQTAPPAFFFKKLDSRYQTRVIRLA